jgi:hypothetical protein
MTMHRIAIGLLLLTISAGAAMNKREQLATQGREGITTIARTITIVNWVGRINKLLANEPAGKALGAKWNANEPHWDKAVDEMTGMMMKVFDDLRGAPEALQRLSMPFQSKLTEDEAIEVLALPPDQRKQLDDYVDTMTLAVTLLEHRPELKVGSQLYRDNLARLTVMARLPEIRDVPKVKLAEKTMRDYQQARTAGVQFFLTAMDGQLELYAFDHRDAMSAIAAKAANAAR